MSTAMEPLLERDLGPSELVAPPVAVRARINAHKRLELAAALRLRIVIVAAIVLGELWALSAAVDAWMGADAAALGPILVFQLLSFTAAVTVWLAAPEAE